MNTKNKLIKRIVEYLNKFNSYRDLRDSIGESNIKEFMPKEFGLEYIGQGCEMYVFRYKKLVIKLGHSNLSKLVPHLSNKNLFGKIVAKIYWLHHAGFAVISEFISHNEDWNSISEYRHWRCRIIAALESLGFDPYDMHSGNIVWDLKRKRGVLIDYGCMEF